MCFPHSQDVSLLTSRNDVPPSNSPPSNGSTKHTICQFLKPRADVLLFDIMTQPNENDCGLSATTELVHGHDPVFCRFKVPSMRCHLLTCLEAGYMSRFPCTRRSVPVRSRVWSEKIYCVCRTPHDKNKPMIQCDECKKRFHKSCTNVVKDERLYVDITRACALTQAELYSSLSRVTSHCANWRLPGICTDCLNQ